MLAKEVIKLGYDRIIFVPAFQSPFKSTKQKDNSAERVDMILAAISGNQQFTVDICELEREGISYTMDTITDITDRYKSETKHAIVLGDDLVADFDKWLGAEDITKKTSVIIAKRHSQTVDFPYPHTVLHNPIIEISSSAIRENIANGDNWEELVNPAVCEIIQNNGYYGCNKKLNANDTKYTNNINNTKSTIENTVRSILNQKRFIHSRNTALLSADLCKHFGLDPNAGYLAGITHDVCKDLTDTEMITLAKKDGLPFSELEQKKPSLLHGRAAAIYIQEIFHITDSDIIQAVRYHTFCKSSMCNLAKIIYLTDKIEVGRTTVEGKLRQLAFTEQGAALTLDELFNIVFDATQKYLLDNGMERA
ncbi:MAG: nicotinate-nucleotide adenylyltransferase [Termitinemataceae bacterium]|nr:MAG: nicotinate-nucleotide adenylyltransferase [Termitinemataceae bacterium]